MKILKPWSFVLTFLSTGIALGLLWQRMKPVTREVAPVVPVANPVPKNNDAQPRSPVLAGFDVNATLDKIWTTLREDKEHQSPLITHISNKETWLLLGEFSPQELEALLQPALTDPTEARRIPLVSVIYEQLAMSSQDRALHWASALPLNAIKPTLGRLMAFWAGHDVDAASKWMERSFPQHPTELAKIYEHLTEVSTSSSRNKPPSSLAQAMTDYQAASQQENNNPENSPVVAWARATNSWEQALEAADGDSALTNTLHLVWGKRNPSAWLEWMKQHPQAGLNEAGEPQGNSKRLIYLLDCLAAIPPGFGSQLARPDTAKLLDDTMALIKEQNPTLKLPKFGQFEMNFKYWAELQPLAASQWVKRNLSESWIDPIVASLATTVVQDDPPAAMVWAGQIQDPELRRKTITTALAIWQKLDPIAASAWSAQ